MKQILKALRSEGHSIRKGWVAVTALFLGLQLLLTAPALAATAVTDVPNITAQPSNWVADEAELLSPLAKRSINSALTTVAKQTGNEIRMVTVRGLNYGVSTQDFADRLFEEWFPIESTQETQTIFVYDAKTKDAAVHVGTDTQAAISPELAESLTSESLLIPIRNGNYNQAFQDTAARVSAIVLGEADPGPPTVETAQLPERNYKTSEETNDFNATIIVVVLLIVATVVPMVTYFIYQN